jgi:hypothetical protein
MKLLSVLFYFPRVITLQIQSKIIMYVINFETCILVSYDQSSGNESIFVKVYLLLFSLLKMHINVTKKSKLITIKKKKKRFRKSKNKIRIKIITFLQ